MPMLHTVNRSPFEKVSFQSCLDLSLDGSVILLYEDAVYAALKGTEVESKITNALKTKKICVLTPDLEARGMRAENVIDGVEAIDYAGFVDLTVENYPVQAWV